MESEENIKSGAEALEHVMRAEHLSPQDKNMLDMEDQADEAEELAVKPADAAPPSWVIMPPNLKMPDGRLITYVRFRASMTDTPNKGERQAILWNLSVADEKYALKRTRGEHLFTMDELTKQMVRAVDGSMADWTGGLGKGNVGNWFDEIGGKCRQQLKNIYAKAHSLTPEEALDFFTDCLAVRTYQAG